MMPKKRSENDLATSLNEWPNALKLKREYFDIIWFSITKKKIYSSKYLVLPVYTSEDICIYDSLKLGFISLNWLIYLKVKWYI